MNKRLCILFLCLWSCFFFIQGQTNYDFRDGTIINTNGGKTADGALALSGTYSFKNSTYGLNMKNGGQIKIAVTGSCTLQFLGSKYSSLQMTGVSLGGNSLGTQYTKMSTDLTGTYDFVYDGAADTLVFTLSQYNGGGSDLYLPLISVTNAQLGKDVSSAAKNIIYNFDLRDGSIVPASTTGQTAIAAGLFSLAVGTKNAYGYNGTTHGSILKPGNQITLQVAGNSYIKFGGCQYSSGTITASSSTGSFKTAALSAKTTKCYHQDGSTVDFLYVGNTGTVTFDFSGTTYVPIISIVPYPYDVELSQWVQKSGTITLNGTTLNLSSGATSSDAATLTTSAGTVISATSEIASVRINLGGNSLDNVSKSFSGDISSLSVSGDTLLVAYSNTSTKPNTYKILVADNSETVSAVAGKTYSYSFMDGTVLPQTSYSSLRYNTFVSEDGILTLNSNTSTAAMQFGFHDSAHGGVFFPGNSMNILVAGNATLTFGTCQYGLATDAVFVISNASGDSIGVVKAKDADGVCGSHSFSYKGNATTLTATLKSSAYPTAEVYIHSLSVENAAKIIKTIKTDVWDLGAAVLDTVKYNNYLTVDGINGWYPGVAAGTTGKSLPAGFTSGVLSYVTNAANSDRLRTSNTNLTRYDSNGVPAYAETDTLSGYLYVNASASAARYLSLTLSADDEVSIYAKSQNGSGLLNFQNVTDNSQSDSQSLTSSATKYKFVAKNAGTFHIYDSKDKPFYYRILRRSATYATLSGSIDTLAAPNLPVPYSIVFTNSYGKQFADTISAKKTSYSLSLPSGYAYSVSLGNANGYIITSGTSLKLNNDTTYHISLKKVNTVNLSGNISGLTSSQLSAAAFTFTSLGDTTFVPMPTLDAVNSTYRVSVLANNKYLISATGVNDYYIVSDTVKIAADSTVNIVFKAKPTYKVDITTPQLTAEQRAKLSLIFTNLNENAYSYTFSNVDSVYLRNGIYSVAMSGLDEYPLQLALTSNLKVNGANVTKALAFRAVTNWSFDDATITANSTTAYKGMLLSGMVYNEKAKGHLVMTGTGSIKVPVKASQKVTLTYYYSANFNVADTNTVVTSSGSTTKLETFQYKYTQSTDGYVTIANNSGTTSYITDVTVADLIPYKSEIYVGQDKDYHTINAALTAVRAMDRTSSQRVRIMVDPGNYEEMLVIDMDSVSLVNASAAPSIALSDNGVHIDANAVRVTSYYGHGYNYYSMGSNVKWSAEALAVNKENGYIGTVNPGSGTTNGSYWNATVVVSGAGFNASNIIFENSYNQYISQKESEDIVQEWASGGKGTRPTSYGSTGVQAKNYVERAAALAYTASGDKSILNNCRVVGRQDSFYGAEGARVVAYKGSLMGATDYIFGGMTLVAYQSDLAMNTSEASTDVAYITAAQQASSRGYLMYECTVTSAQPGTETASSYLSKPGYFGRPWQATTSEVVFYNTTIKTTNNPSYSGLSLITADGWNNSLGGTSAKCYEYGTIEESGASNSANRVNWATLLSSAKLTDGTAITTYNFTKGTDGWDPITSLVRADDVSSINSNAIDEVSLKVYSVDDMVYIKGIDLVTNIKVYSLDGSLKLNTVAAADTQFALNKGIWIVKASSLNKATTVKINVK